ncbi:MAG: HEAT repeat domain-containing protein [Myxococcota bacterium]|nr:HEAT repeat domain-containing protein [Myxococcota bacterium]
MRLLFVSLTLFASACTTTPDDPNEQMLADLASEDAKVRVAAAEGLRKVSLQLRKMEGAREKVLTSFAGDGSHRGTLAMVMGRAFGEEIVPELLKGLRIEGLVPVTSSEKEANNANRSIGTALQELAINHGIKLGDGVSESVARYANSGDIQTALTFIELLGLTGSKRGTGDLLEMIADSDNNFIVKNCVIALGNIRDPAALDTLIEHMFRERMGVSFYAEASFALFQHGGVEGLQAKLETAFAGKNEKVNDMMKGSKACQDAKGVCYIIQAKVAEVMSDVGLSDAQVVSLNKIALSKGANQQLVTKIIEALGRTGSAKAVPEIMKHKSNLTVREFVGRSIARIGDRKAALALAKQGSHRSFLADAKKMGYGAEAASKSELEIRRFTLENASRAGDDKVTKEIEAQIKAEKVPKIRAMMEQQLKRSTVYDKCKADMGCYRKLLYSDEPMIREKAAYEIAYARDEGSIGELVKSIHSSVDNTNESRFAKFWALWQIGPQKGKKYLKRLSKMAEVDKKNQDYVRIAAEVERLVDRMRR